MSIIAEALKSKLRKEMRKRTQEILDAVQDLKESREEMVESRERVEKAVDNWIKFMREVIQELKE